MNKSYIKTKLVIALLFLASSIMSCASIADTPQSLDRLLINSLAKDDLNTARELLEKGANPEAILGKLTRDSAVCTAIDDDRSKNLELLIEFGASPNAFWTNAHSTQRTPLACAVQKRNFEAFYYLLDNGADPTVDLVPEGLEKFQYRSTAFTAAIALSIYPMALELLNRYELREREVQYAINTFNSSGYGASHPWSYARDEINDWLKQRVPSFIPPTAAPVPNLTKGECLRSPRDLREGKKKGSICPRAEEQ